MTPVEKQAEPHYPFETGGQGPPPACPGTTGQNRQTCTGERDDSKADRHGQVTGWRQVVPVVIVSQTLTLPLFYLNYAIPVLEHSYVGAFVPL